MQQSRIVKNKKIIKNSASGGFSREISNAVNSAQDLSLDRFYFTSQTNLQEKPGHIHYAVEVLDIFAINFNQLQRV